MEDPGPPTAQSVAATPLGGISTSGLSPGWDKIPGPGGCLCWFIDVDKFHELTVWIYHKSPKSPSWKGILVFVVNKRSVTCCNPYVTHICGMWYGSYPPNRMHPPVASPK